MSKQTGLPFDGEDWAEAQQNYWNAWSDLCQQAMAGTAPGKADHPWAAGLEQWWKLLSGKAPEQSREYFERIVEQGQGFMTLGQEMTRFLSSINELNKTGDDWKEVLSARFEDMKQTLSGKQGDLNQLLKGMFAFTDLPLDTLRRTASAGSLLPGDFFESLRAGAWSDQEVSLHEHVQRSLSVPGVGYTRESQAQQQKLASLLLDYQRVNQEYNQAHGQVAMDTLDRMLQKILDMSERDEEITSLRQIYDLWVDCGEAAYAEFVSSDEYSDLYGRMVNALMALKKQGQNMVDENMGALGAPTRREIDTVLRRQQEVRRRLQEMQAGDTGAELQQLQSEVESLRAEMASLRGLLNQPAKATPAKPAPAGKKAASRKKTTARKKTTTRKKTSTRKKKTQAAGKTDGE